MTIPCAAYQRRATASGCAAPKPCSGNSDHSSHTSFDLFAFIGAQSLATVIMSGLIALLAAQMSANQRCSNRIVGRRIAIVHDQPASPATVSPRSGMERTLLYAGGYRRHRLLRGEKSGDVHHQSGVEQVDMPSIGAGDLFCRQHQEGVVPLDRESPTSPASGNRSCGGEQGHTWGRNDANDFVSRDLTKCFPSAHSTAWMTSRQAAGPLPVDSSPSAIVDANAPERRKKPS